MRHRCRETGFLLLLDEAMLAVKLSGVPSSTFALTTSQVEREGSYTICSLSDWLHESDAAVIVAWPLSLAFCTDYGNWRCKQCENEKLDAIAKVM